MTSDIVERWKHLARVRMLRERPVRFSVGTRSPRRSMRMLSLAASISMIGLLSIQLHWLALLPATGLAVFAVVTAALRLVAASGDRHSGALSLANRAAVLLQQGDAAGAGKAAEQGLAVARSPGVRRRLREALVWAAIGQREPIEAHVALARLQESAIDYHLVSAYLSCCNRVEEAVQLLREARDLGHRDPESTKLLIDLLYRSGEIYEALSVASADATLLSAEDRRRIAAAFPQRGFERPG